MAGKFSFARCVIAVLLTLSALVCLYPLWYTLIVSFSNKAYVSAGKTWIVPLGVNVEAYRKMLSDRQFFASFLVSVERTALGCAVNMLLLVITSYPLSLPRGHFKFQRPYLWFLIANMLFSGGLIPAYMVIRNYKLFDSLLALVLPGALPIYYMILMLGFFRNVPFDMNEAAIVDGANPWVVLFRVYVPVSLPSLACVLLFCFVGHWNAYFDGLLYMNNPAGWPLQTYIYQISALLDPQTMTAEQLIEASKISDLTLNSAKVIVALVPILALYPFLQRYFIVGMTMGAVKG